MSGRHAQAAARRHRFALLLSVTTVLGVWFGVNAPDVSPVAAPVPVVQVQPSGGDVVAPVAPAQEDPRPRRGGGR